MPGKFYSMFAYGTEEGFSITPSPKGASYGQPPRARADYRIIDLSNDIIRGSFDESDQIVILGAGPAAIFSVFKLSELYPGKTFIIAGPLLQGGAAASTSRLHSGSEATQDVDRDSAGKSLPDNRSAQALSQWKEDLMELLPHNFGKDNLKSIFSEFLTSYKSGVDSRGTPIRLNKFKANGVTEQFFNWKVFRELIRKWCSKKVNVILLEDAWLGGDNQEQLQLSATSMSEIHTEKKSCIIYALGENNPQNIMNKHGFVKNTKIACIININNNKYYVTSQKLDSWYKEKSCNNAGFDVCSNESKEYIRGILINHICGSLDGFIHRDDFIILCSKAGGFAESIDVRCVSQWVRTSNPKVFSGCSGAGLVAVEDDGAAYIYARKISSAPQVAEQLRIALGERCHPRAIREGVSKQKKIEAPIPKIPNPTSPNPTTSPDTTKGAGGSAYLPELTLSPPQQRSIGQIDGSCNKDLGSFFCRSSLFTSSDGVSSGECSNRVEVLNSSDECSPPVGKKPRGSQ